MSGNNSKTCQITEKMLISVLKNNKENLVIINLQQRRYPLFARLQVKEMG